MCTLIVNPAKAAPLTLNEFINLWDNNPDGAGFAYVSGKEVTIIKEMKNPAALHTQYLEVRKRNAHPIILHFRISTQGNVNLANAHPFRVNKGLIFAHNGVLTAAPYDKEKSDTAIFVRDILQRWPADFDTRPPYIQALNYIAGRSNKFALLNRHGQATMINIGGFHIHNGSYYSNKGYLSAYDANPISSAVDYKYPKALPPTTGTGYYSNCKAKPKVTNERENWWKY